MKYHLKFAITNLKKSKFTSGLNVVGLTCAFTAFVLIMVYVWNEKNFDTYNQHANEIFRVEIKSPGNDKTSVYLAGPTGQTLVDEFPEILASTTFIPWGKWGEIPVSWEGGSEQVKSHEDYAYSDEFLTDVFTFNLKYGKQNRPLAEPNTAIVSESFARRAWGDIDPTGKLLLAGGANYTVTAVFKDLPENSVIQCPIILKMPTSGWIAEAYKTWGVVNYPQFILTQPGTDKNLLNEKINSLQLIKEKYSYFNRNQATVSLVARPLTELRFNNETAETPMFSSNSKMFVNLLFWVGMLIILVAVINYINFAVAGIPRRLKGVTISRIVGSTRKNLVAVFITETLFLFVSSFAIALAAAMFVNKYVSSQVFGYPLPFSGKPLFWGIMFAGIVGLGIISAIYPALVSTTGSLVENLKKQKVKTRFSFRGVLTVSQFAATIALITSSIFVVKQVLFMEKAELGFQKNNTLVISMNDDLKKNYKSFEDKLRQNPYIADMACSRAVPGRAQEMQVFNVGGKTCQLWYWAVDDNYIDMMGFSFAEGRDFLKKSEAENSNLVCNETAAKKFGWKIGEKVGNGVLVGILKDFNFVSLRDKVEPFAFWYSDSNQPFSNISIKLARNNTAEAVSFIKKAFEEVSPNTAFRYFFLDDHLNQLYVKESRQVKLITGFSLLSIVVSILGILGLSAFICQNNIKEIGIRKVNGARVSEILYMLNFDFARWIGLAFVIATPVVWQIMQRWIESFAYKTTLSWWIFALAGLLALGIALLTVSWQSWKAATRNPVEALRYE
jgi:putative ABC transport system permease protein